jgi:hypothetical protein
MLDFYAPKKTRIMYKFSLYSPNCMDYAIMDMSIASWAGQVQLRVFVFMFVL